jgi:Tol biopolymer transport system component
MMMRRRTLRAGLVSLAAFAAAIGPVPHAAATYPGVPGRIVFEAAFSGTAQLYSIRGRDGLRLRQLTHFRHSIEIELPAISPNGQLIAFDGGRIGAENIYLMNADGTDRRRITDDPGSEHSPSFSPDGARIVFGNDIGIATMALDGSDRQQLTAAPDFKPQYTPDGSRILFESQRGGLISAIWSMNPDGSEPQRLTPGRLRAGGLDISPDGQRVVFFSNENFPLPNSLYVMGIDGSDITRLTNPPNGSHDLWPAYSPDGDEIVFSSDRAYPSSHCCFEVWKMRADGSRLIPLTSNLTPDGCENGNCVYPVWMPKPPG